MALPKVLLVEDEESHRIVIEKALKGHVELIVADSMKSGLEAIHSNEFNLFILDVMLGDGDGFELCSLIRKFPKFKLTPVMFLSSKGETASKVLGLALGADDYIVKPCDPSELRARVDSKLRWTYLVSSANQEVSIGPFMFYLEMHKLEVKENDSEKLIELSPLEFKLFYYLAAHKDKIYSRDQLLEAVWGQATNVLDRSVDTYVAAIRKKLGPYKQCLKSVHGVGYKFTLDQLATKKAS